MSKPLIKNYYIFQYIIIIILYNYIICYYYHLQVRMGLMWQSGNVAKWRKALKEVTALLARAYGSLGLSLRLVLCVEMVVNNLGFCRPYDGR